MLLTFPRPPLGLTRDGLDDWFAEQMLDAQPIAHRVRDTLHALCLSQVQHAIDKAGEYATALGLHTPRVRANRHALSAWGNPWPKGSVEHDLMRLAYEVGVDSRTPTSVLMGLFMPRSWSAPRVAESS